MTTIDFSNVKNLGKDVDLSVEIICVTNNIYLLHISMSLTTPKNLLFFFSVSGIVTLIGYKFYNSRYNENLEHAANPPGGVNDEIARGVNHEELVGNEGATDPAGLVEDKAADVAEDEAADVAEDTTDPADVVEDEAADVEDTADPADVVDDEAADVVEEDRKLPPGKVEEEEVGALKDGKADPHVEDHAQLHVEKIKKCDT